MDINRHAPVRASAEGMVAAPIDLVWKVQADLGGWPAWNPDVTRVVVRGPVAPGTVFKWKAGGMTIISKLEEVDPPGRIGWTGRALGLRAVHVWRFTASGDQTHVRTEESFEGILARLFPGWMRRTLASSLEKGLEALRRECQRRASSRGEA